METYLVQRPRSSQNLPWSTLLNWKQVMHQFAVACFPEVCRLTAWSSKISVPRGCSTVCDAMGSSGAQVFMSGGTPDRQGSHLMVLTAMMGRPTRILDHGKHSCGSRV